jgi:hypothetical protein
MVLPAGCAGPLAGQLGCLVGGFLLFLLLLPALLHLLGGLIMMVVSLFLFGAIAQSMIGGGGFRGPNVGGIASGITRSLFGTFRRGFHGGSPHPSRREVTVYEVTLEDSATRRLVLVRIEGDFVEGTVAESHDIEVEGIERNGTILFRSGINYSLGLNPAGTQIRVSRSGSWGR